MGRSLFALENDAEAERAVGESLRIANEIHGTLAALEALAVLASLQAKQGNLERALKILQIIMNHSASLPETKDYAAHLRIELEAQLTDQQVDAALVRAQTTTFEAIVEETFAPR